MAVEMAPTVDRYTCPACGAEAVAQDSAWLDRFRSVHRCPTPEEITLALRGAYDG